MKLGPLVIQVEVSREPCRCGAAPVKAMIPVQVGMTTVPPAQAMTSTGFTFDVHLDTARVRRDAEQALMCRRCEA